MVYVSKPKPSKGYVSLLILVLLEYPALSIIGFIINFNSETSIITINSIIIAIFGPPLLLAFGIFWFSVYIIGPSLLLQNVEFWIIEDATWMICWGILFIHPAYNTEYRIEDGKLWMKYGYLRKKSLSLDEIKGIEKVDSLSGFRQPSFHNRFYCNRLKNGVKIITEDSTIWVSPEDIEKFVSKLGLKDWQIN